jgi:hypothetical protein
MPVTVSQPPSVTCIVEMEGARRGEFEPGVDELGACLGDDLLRGIDVRHFCSGAVAYVGTGASREIVLWMLGIADLAEHINQGLWGLSATRR